MTVPCTSQKLFYFVSCLDHVNRKKYHFVKCMGQSFCKVHNQNDKFALLKCMEKSFVPTSQIRNHRFPCITKMIFHCIHIVQARNKIK